MARVKDPDMFEQKLNDPPPGSSRRASEAERQKDAESFMAFAGAFGVTPP